MFGYKPNGEEQEMPRRLIALLTLALLTWIASTWGPSWYQQTQMKKQLRLETILNDPAASTEELAAARRALMQNKAARRAEAIQERLATPPELRAPRKLDLVMLPETWQNSCLERQQQVLQAQEKARGDLAAGTPGIDTPLAIHDDLESTNTAEIESLLDQLNTDKQWLDRHCRLTAAGGFPLPPEADITM